MNKNTAIKNFKELKSVAIGSNGYPIYDLFQTVYPDNGHGDKLSGYVGSTGIMFYSEDEKLLNELDEVSEMDSVEEYQKFFKKNIKNLYNSSELREVNISELRHEESFAYGHLCTPEAIKKTFSGQYYGVAHLDMGNELLIFRQGEINGHFSISKYNLNELEDYKKVRGMILDLYNDNKIKPEARITGKPYENVKLALSKLDLNSVSEYQKNIALLLIDFKNEMRVFELSFDNTNDNYQATIKNNNLKFSFVIPKDKKDNYVLKQENSEDKRHKDIASVLDEVYSISKKQEINKFISKIKI